MDKQRPYEELDQHFSHLPLPDENRAWEQMEALLDKEEDKDRFIVLPPFLQGCGGWALLLLLVVGTGLWLYLHRSPGQQDPTGASAPRTQKETTRNPISTHQQATTNTNNHSKGENPAAPGGTTTHPNPGGPVATPLPVSTANPQATERQAPNPSVRTKKTRPSSLSEVRSSRSVLESKPYNLPEEPVTTHPDESETKDKQRPAPQSAKDSMQPAFNPAAAPVDSTTTPTPADSAQTTPGPKEKGKRKSSIAVGIALQQQLPLNGEKTTPYSYLGRKGSLADYIPSLYLRWHRDPQWFLQTGFRYGAPQYTREFVYNQEYVKDSMGMVRSTTSYRLKKTYYHQLPLSFHYRVTPRWSVGLGGIYNRFYGAVSEKEVRARTAPTVADSLISKGLVTDKSDSLFRRSGFQVLLETQYRWKRFSLGARWTQGVQPYIEYTDPAGQKKKEKNHALNLFLRYELWRSPKP